MKKPMKKKMSKAEMDKMMRENMLGNKGVPPFVGKKGKKKSGALPPWLGKKK